MTKFNPTVARIASLRISAHTLRAKGDDRAAKTFEDSVSFLETLCTAEELAMESKVIFPHEYHDEYELAA